jgi:hypothetical protein
MREGRKIKNERTNKRTYCSSKHLSGHWVENMLVDTTLQRTSTKLGVETGRSLEHKKQSD